MNCTQKWIFATWILMCLTVLIFYIEIGLKSKLHFWILFIYMALMWSAGFYTALVKIVEANKNG